MPWLPIPGAQSPGGQNPFPQNAFPPVVRNSSWGAFTNLSGIPHDLDKWQSKPPGWDIADQGYKEQFSLTGTEAEIVWFGPWTNRFAFLDWVLGYSRTVSVPFFSIPLISRIPPIQHPEMPWLYAVDAELVDAKGAAIRSSNSFALDFDNTPLMQAAPVTQPSPQPPPPAPPQPPGPGQPSPPPPKSQILLPMVAYANNTPAAYDDGYAYYRVRYTKPDYEIRNNSDPSLGQYGELSRWVSRRATYAIQALNMNALTQSQLVFLTTGPTGPTLFSVIPEGGLFLIPTLSLVYTWHQVPDVPWDAINACLGRVNAADFDGVTSAYAPGEPGYPKYPAGTMLCQPPTINRTSSRAGRVSWEIEYRFDVRFNPSGGTGNPLGWNGFPFNDGNFYLAGVGKIAQTPIYKSADFSQLFLPRFPVVVYQ